MSKLQNEASAAVQASHNMPTCQHQTSGGYAASLLFQSGQELLGIGDAHQETGTVHGGNVNHMMGIGDEYQGFRIVGQAVPAGFVARIGGSTAAPFGGKFLVGSSRVDLQACKLEYSIVSPK